jgi:hypothetical protein
MSMRAALDTVTIEGGLFTEEFLKRVGQAERGGEKLEGLDASTYGLPKKVKLRDELAERWGRLLALWQELRQEEPELLTPGHEPRADVEARWLFPLFDELGYGATLQTPQHPTLRDRGISHAWGALPIHLIAWGQTFGKPIASGIDSPHSLLQRTLNDSSEHLWGVLSDGLTLRLLRDHHSLTRLSFVEWDLAAIFEGENYHDFVTLWLMLHSSRVRANERPDEAILESWFERSKEDGVQALDALREGVKEAIEILGSAFIDDPSNQDLRRRLATTQSEVARAVYRQLLQLIYRIIFTLVAEARDLLHDPDVDPKYARVYGEFYAFTPLLERAITDPRGDRKGDLWRRICVVFDSLREGQRLLALPALGSALWSPLPEVEQTGIDLSTCACSNHAVLRMLHALGMVERDGVLTPVNWREVGADELGPIYEWLLEFRPTIARRDDGAPQRSFEVPSDSRVFQLENSAGNERKSTGAYYTPEPLVQVLLRESLDPLIERTMREHDTGEARAEALLGLTICDPACGSGHFLVAAAHRLAHAVAAARTGVSAPEPKTTREALRKVVTCCIYGVDMNPMAVELCKISLWLESIVPGKPLSFLDAHIQCGNALIGAWPALMDQGIARDAFPTQKDLDDNDVAKAVRERNRKEFDALNKPLLNFYAQQFLVPFEREAAARRAETLADVRRQAESWQEYTSSQEFESAHQLADVWCASFMWPLTSEHADHVPTANVWHDLRFSGGNTQPKHKRTIEFATTLARKAQFFHWHLAFPQIFTAPKDSAHPELPSLGVDGGFSLVLGNPPWERIKLQEKEFFVGKDDGIATASNKTERNKRIKKLPATNPALYQEFTDAQRVAAGMSNFVRTSGRYLLCGRGDVNTYALFAEHNRDTIAPMGRAGFIVPTGIATDDTTKYYFQSIMEGGNLFSLFDFENRNIFSEVHNSFKFSLVTLTGSDAPVDEAIFVFFAHHVDDLEDEKRQITLSAEDIKLINPNTRTCPIFRYKRDAEITKSVYRRVPVFVRDKSGDEPEQNPWDVSFSRMFDMSNDSEKFFTLSDLNALPNGSFKGSVFTSSNDVYFPLYEGRMIDFYNHRNASIGVRPDVVNRNAYSIPVELDELQDASHCVRPRYWVKESANLNFQNYSLCFRDITSATNQRTFVPCVVPKSGLGNKTPKIHTPNHPVYLYAILSSFIFDFEARQKVGGVTLNYFILKQLPVVGPTLIDNRLPLGDSSTWFDDRVVELTYTNWEMQKFAYDIGYKGPPFVWNNGRRFNIKCELDAAFFHLYDIERDDVDYIMETFPIVKRQDEAEYGEYKTKRVILECYDAMAKAMESGGEYETIVDPPPASPEVAHPPRET